MNSWLGFINTDEEPVEKDELVHDPELDSIVRNDEHLKSIEVLRQSIFNFKNLLYTEIVINDRVHSANTMEAMRNFHAVFLQTIAYLIGLLDSAEVPAPQFSNSIQPIFKLLTIDFLKLRNLYPDSYALLYNMLFQFSTQHPFDLGKEKPESENNSIE
jgi:hypothetical protein